MTIPGNPAPARPDFAFIFLLGVMASTSPLGMSIHVQSIPAIADDLGASYAAVQLTVSLYLFTFAAAQLFVGPLSDRLGRRPVLFGGLVVFAAASLAAALAPTIEIMLAARVVQAAGGCAALVTPRAVIQDRYSGAEAARMMAFVAILQSMAPITAPIFGGGIDWAFGWRAIFAFLAGFALLIGLVAAMRMPESRPTEAGRVASWATIFSRYRSLLGKRRYLAYTAVFAFGTTGYFGFLAVAPAVMIGELGIPPVGLSVMLTAISLQFVIAGYLGTRLVLRFGIDRVLFVGAIVQLVGVAAFWIVARDPTALLVTLAFCVYTFSNGLVFANSLAGAISVDPRIAASAASFLGSLQFLVGGVVALALAELPTAGFGYLPEVLVALGLGTFSSMLVVRRLRT